MSQRDAELLRPYFSDDVVYHNIPMDPAEGIEATMAMIDMFLGMCEGLEFEIHHLASDGATVLTERTDTFTMQRKDGTPPRHGCLPCRRREDHRLAGLFRHGTGQRHLRNGLTSGGYRPQAKRELHGPNPSSPCRRRANASWTAGAAW